MRIAIYAAGMPFDGKTIPDGDSLGGSESAAYYMAKELVKLGHHVICFTCQEKPTGADGVVYTWIGERTETFPLGYQFHAIMQAPHDVLILQRHPQGFKHRYNTKLNIWWLHDIALGRQAGVIIDSLVNIDRVFTVSEWHKNQVSEVYGIDKEFITATTNGVDYDAFGDTRRASMLVGREPFSMIYIARPERGLENLVKEGGIMEQLPECKLYVCGYDNTTDDMRSYYQMLWDRCEQLPNVENLGNLGKSALYEKMKSCMLYVYPTTFEDTSCIAVLEANAAGLPVIGTNGSAVPETIEGGGAILLNLRNGEVNQKAFVKAIKGNITGKNWRILHDEALEKKQTWQSAAIQWDNVIRKELEFNSLNKHRLAKHFEQMSDIAVIKERGMTQYIDKWSKKYGFFVNNTFAEHYKAYYEYEKSRGVEYGPEDLTGNKRFETTCNLIKKFNPSTVLDYGCAHGHYTINLAKRFPDIEFIGIDICQSNINTAIKWCEDEGLQDRVEFKCYDFMTDDLLQTQGYDLILCSEVLEHVADPIKLVSRLEYALEPQTGTMLLSTPYGPWEAIGYGKHSNWRAHLHHFERDDLADMFSDQRDYRLLAIPHTGILGHFMFHFTPNGNSYGAIDYDRKIRQQAPQETLSVCMIVKDAEYTLGHTLEGIQHITDEIIIGIDDATMDDTRRVAEKFGARCIDIVSPMKQGFDNARNETIDTASMDWILWIDADETIEYADIIPQYLRNNCYNGYAIAQNHFAAEPAGLLKTDYPVRIFRNNKDIKFYGHIHEHPELLMNSGVGKVCIMPKVAIMHTGYGTEMVRRERFKRNWPLMQEDHKRHPERILGRFLWIRDLAHCIRYNLEMNDRRIKPDDIDNSLKIVDEWRELVKTGNDRYIKESIQYYTEAVNVLTQGKGIEFGIAMDASKFNGGIQPQEAVKGMFLNEGDIDLLLTHLKKTVFEKFQGKYY